MVFDMTLLVAIRWEVDGGGIPRAWGVDCLSEIVEGNYSALCWGRFFV